MHSNPPYPAGQALHPNSQAEAWGHPSQYAHSQQQWQAGQQPPQNHYGNPVRPPHPPAWPGTGTGAPPPYQPKVRLCSRHVVQESVRKVKHARCFRINITNALRRWGLNPG